MRGRRQNRVSSMRASGQRLVSMSVLCLNLGCGPTVDEAEGSGGSGSESASTPTTEAPGTTEDPSCEQYAAAPDIGPAVRFRVRNDSEAPIYVDVEVVVQ